MCIASRGPGGGPDDTLILSLCLPSASVVAAVGFFLLDLGRFFRSLRGRDVGYTQ